MKWQGKIRLQLYSLAISNLIQKSGVGQGKQKKYLRSIFRKKHGLWLLAYGIDWVERDQKSAIKRTVLYC